MVQADGRARAEQPSQRRTAVSRRVRRLAAEIMPAVAIVILLLVNCNRSRAENPGEPAPASEKYDATRFDAYGGDVAHGCQGNGFFRLYKDEQAKQWYFCTPDNHRFWMQAVQVVTRWDDAVDRKYTGLGRYGFYAGTAARLKHLGFNTLGELAAPSAFPVATQGRHDDGNPEKMPFIYNMNPTRYAFQGTAGWGWCKEPAFDIVEGLSPAYKGWRSSFPDVFSPAWACAVHASFANNQDITGGMGELNKSRWVIGVQFDDADYMQGFKAGPESGDEASPHTGWLAAVSAPYRRYSRLHGALFVNDPVNYTKQEWVRYLQAKYGSVAALNTAWKSDYTSWESSAKEVVREPLLRGDGHQWEFAVKLKHAPVDLNSLGLYVDQRAVGGDCPWTVNNGGCDRGLQPGWGILAGTDWANLDHATIRYSTGELKIRFSAVPPAGVTIYATYRYGGWPRQSSGGRGVLDEDGSSPWWPKDDTLRKIDGPVAQDLDEFLSRIAARYFEVLDSERKKYFGNHLLIGPDALSVFTRQRILVEAAKHVDMFLVSSAEPGEPRTSAARRMYDATGIPVYPYMVGIANGDSPYSSVGMKGCEKNGWNMNCMQTQAGRGQWYNRQIAEWQNNFRGSDGYGFVVGVSWWQLTDNAGEKTNFGLVSLKDNLYDGVQSSPGATVDEFGIPRGGEARNYGAFTPWVRFSNQCWWKPDAAACKPAR